MTTGSSRKANPNASTSEMDPRFKTIKPFIHLTNNQRDELIEQFTEIVVDGMDMDALIQYAQEQMFEYFDGLNDIELREEVINHQDEDLYDELVDNVTSAVDDAVKEVEKCIIDTNGEYAECVDHLLDSLSEGKEYND